MNLVDSAKIHLEAGSGGNGCGSFFRGPNIAIGKPDGGNGGSGGDLIIEAASTKTSLLDYRYKQHFMGQRGNRGQKNNKSGLSGKNLRILVPMGTEIYMEDKATLIKDLCKPGDSFLVAKGGRGGHGNAFYKSSKNRSPQTVQKGEKGDELWIWLRLKIPCHVAIVGSVNSGKSTFFNSLSGAKSEVASYPYTTKSPKLGNVILDYEDWIFMDTPPLNERLFQHLERCLGLIYITSAKEDLELEVKKIRTILTKGNLEKKPFLVVVTMCDLVKAETVKKKVTALACPVLISSTANKSAILKLFGKVREKIE